MMLVAVTHPPMGLTFYFVASIIAMGFTFYFAFYRNVG